MLRKIFVALIVVCFGLLLFQSDSFAVRKNAKFRHANKNKDSVVDKKEWRMENKWERRKKKQKTSGGNTWWEKRADTNADGAVDSSELAAWKKIQKERIDLNGDGEISAKERRLCWRHAKNKVNTRTERRYDVNGNGWLETEEVKTMLRERHKQVKRKGKVKVDSTVEEEYDSNNDGVIDEDESKDIAEDLLIGDVLFGYTP